MADFDNIKNFVLSVVNGNAPASSIATRNVQESAKRIGAEATQAFQTAKVVTPQLAKIGVEIGKLEALKVAKQAELTAIKDSIEIINASIEVANTTLETTKKTKAELQKRAAKVRAKKKTNGEEVKDEDNTNDVQEERKNLDKLKSKRKGLEDKADNIQKDIDSYENQISELKKQTKILNAQISPKAALIEAKADKELAQKKVDEAPTPEAKEEAEKQLEETTQMEETIQQVSDDTESSIDQVQEQQEPEMMMIQADFELIKTGVNTINYLVTNIPILFSAASISIGANGGGPVPMLPSVSLPLGNVLFGYAFFILADVKAASVRMLANCQKIGYTPTVEMTYIQQIPTAEASLMGLSSIAPAGAALTQL